MAESTTGVIVVRQVQYQPIARPVFIPAAAVVPEQQPTQPEIPVQPRRVGWALPTLFFTPPPDAIQAGWAPTFPAWIARAPRAAQFQPVAFTPQHEDSEGSTTGWRGYQPAWVARKETRWAYQTGTFVQSHDSFQTWKPTYPDYLWSRDLPTAQRQSFAFTPAHEAAEGNALDWTPRYPDWLTHRWIRPLGGWTAPLLVATGTEFPRGTFPDLLWRTARTVPTEFAWSTDTPAVATPSQPWIVDAVPVRMPARVAQTEPPWTFIPQPEAPKPWVTSALPIRPVARVLLPDSPWTFTPAAIPHPWVEPAFPVRRIAQTFLPAAAWSTFTPSATPEQPWTESPFPVRALLRAPEPALAWSAFTPPVPTQFWTATPDPTRLIARTAWTEFAWHPDTPVAPVPDLPPTSAVFPVWAKQWHPSLQIESRGPIAPLPTPTIQRVIGIVGAVLEQSGGSYIATLRDPQGNILPGSILQTLRLTLYTVNRDNTFSIVNSRQKQPCLNINDVTVYDALQTAANGKRFNLRWRFQPADTTMIDPALAFERHMMLWEYTWADGAGKHEATIVVHNLRVVS